jgi:hypothetical protein
LSRTWKIKDNFTVDTQIFHDFFSYNNTWQLAPTQFSRTGLQDTRTGGEIQANYHLSDVQTIISGFSYAKEQQGNLIDELGTDPTHLIISPSTAEERLRRRWGVYIEDVSTPDSDLIGSLLKIIH